jgi:hypothetical protein
MRARAERPNVLTDRLRLPLPAPAEHNSSGLIVIRPLALLDLAGFPPHDRQTAVLKSGSEMIRAGVLL